MFDTDLVPDDDEAGADSSSRLDSDPGRKRDEPLSPAGLPLLAPRCRGFGVVVVVVEVVVVVDVVVVGAALQYEQE